MYFSYKSLQTKHIKFRVTICEQLQKIKQIDWEKTNTSSLKCDTYKLCNILLKVIIIFTNVQIIQI